MPAKDRTDIVAQVIATEALAMALAKLAIVGMSEKQKQGFAADVAANAAAICDEINAQAPAIGRARGLSVDAANARGAMIEREAKALAKAHVDALFGTGA